MRISKRSTAARYLMMFAALLSAIVFNAGSGYAQGINYPVGSPTGTSGTGNALTHPDNLFMRNNIAGMTELPVNLEEENSGQLSKHSKGAWRISGELQYSFYKYTRDRVLPGPTQGITSRATVAAPSAAGEMTYTSGDHKYAFGVGAYQLFGFSAKIEDDPAKFGARATFFDTKVASNDIAIGGAIRLHKTLSVGGAFIFGRAFLDLKAPTEAAVFFGQIRQTRLDATDIGGAGASVSVHFRPADWISFGLNYKSERKYELEGALETFVLRFGPTGANFIPVAPEALAKFKLPTVAEGGVAVKATKKMTVAFDFRFYDYTETLQAVSVREKTSGVTLLQRNVGAQDVRSIRLGILYNLNDTTKLSFGSAFTTNGFPEEAINPGLINVGGLDISGSVSKKVHGQWLTAGVAGIFGRARKVGPPKNPFFAGIYDGQGVLVSLGMRLQIFEKH